MGSIVVITPVGLAVGAPGEGTGVAWPSGLPAGALDGTLVGSPVVTDVGEAVRFGRHVVLRDNS